MVIEEYTEEIVSIAKRENNTKRAYLVVNRLQGKHIPVEPSKPMGMFHALAQKVKAAYQGQALLAVGFAETATAIGAAVAAELGIPYIQTTREAVPGVEYLYFSEAHSHAAEQKLMKDDLDQMIGGIGRIVFIEDEVTTGNTILNIIGLLRNHYGNQIRFSVASLLNGMDEEAMGRYLAQQIDALYLVKTDHSSYGKVAGQSAGDGVYHKPSKVQGGGDGAACPSGRGVCQADAGQLQEIRIPGAQNARRLVQGAAYQAACQALWEKVQEAVPFETAQDVLVLGTEEFMYPPLFVAHQLQLLGHKVKCHATTRSPIAVSREKDYPLHERYELASLYDGSRVTYVYDLAQYSLVLILTDAPCQENREGSISAGLVSLQDALCSCGNQNIYCIRWCET